MNRQKNLSSLIFISSLFLLGGCADLNKGFVAADGSSLSGQDISAVRDAFYYPAEEIDEEVSPFIEEEEEEFIEEQGELVFTPPLESEMNGPGVLKPTVYYFAIINEDKNGCSASEMRSLHGAGGVELLKVCAKTHATCGIQGSCGIVQKGKLHTFNIIGRFSGQDRYFSIDDEKCPFGYGVRNSCLDPFYTLAADLSIYKTGEVIYIPSLVGLELPDGSLHDGYFVIRDQGRAIKGRGRFDFFSGHLSWYDPSNPFKKVGLGSVSTNIPYFRISGKTAKRVLEERAFPHLPANAVTFESF